MRHIKMILYGLFQSFLVIGGIICDIGIVINFVNTKNPFYAVGLFLEFLILTLLSVISMWGIGNDYYFKKQVISREKNYD